MTRGKLEERAETVSEKVTLTKFTKNYQLFSGERYRSIFRNIAFLHGSTDFLNKWIKPRQKDKRLLCNRVKKVVRSLFKR